MARRREVVGLLLITVLGGCGGPQPSPTQALTPPVVSATAPTAGPSTSPTAHPTTSLPAASADLGPHGAVPALTLTVVASGLEQPLDVAVRPGHPDDVYVVEQAGRVRLIRSGALVSTPVLDIAGSVTAGGEQGLLGLAFHPDPADGRFFVYYTGLDGSEILSSFTMSSSSPDRADPSSEKVLLKMADRYANHNGGSLAFGPDGYLYIGTGDGGGGGDPLGSGRRLDTLLAKVLRIDVDHPGASGAPYAIPGDNPFVGRAGARPEIWLTGLRNPWRMRFDRATGDLWIGDVGQGAWEEVDVARAGIGGLDYGWNVMEGFACYGASTCATKGLTLPVAAYGHDQGCSVIGGTVYRGSALPTLRGWYVFADYCSGRMWVLDPTRTGRQVPKVAFDSGRSISAIGEDPAGNLLVTDLAKGQVLRIGVSGG